MCEMGERRSALWIITLCWAVSPPWKSARGEKCGNISMFEPFGSGGSFPYAQMVRCNANKTLQLRTVRGPFDVQSVDYESKRLSIWDPSLSTCETLTPLGSQYFSPDSILPPSNDTTLLLLNCSAHSVVTRNSDHFCADPTSSSSVSCHEMYDDCPAFKGLVAGLKNSSALACCVSSYERVGKVGMKEVGCSHYTSGYRRRREWGLGITLSFRQSEEEVPDIGDFCQRCDPDRHGFQISQDHRTCGIGRQCICYPHKCDDDFFSRAVPNTKIESIVILWVLLAGVVLWTMF